VNRRSRPARGLRNTNRTSPESRRPAGPGRRSMITRTTRVSRLLERRRAGSELRTVSVAGASLASG
jgi:hypothetical protein